MAIERSKSLEELSESRSAERGGAAIMNTHQGTQSQHMCACSWAHATLMCTRVHSHNLIVLERCRECQNESHPQTLVLPHLWQVSCPRPELHHTPGGGGEKRQHSCWKLVLTAVCVSRPHSGCHYDSIWLAGYPWLAEKHTRAISEVNYIYAPCLHPSPVWCTSRLSDSGWRHGLRLPW